MYILYLEKGWWEIMHVYLCSLINISFSIFNTCIYLTDEKMCFKKYAKTFVNL